MYICRLLAYFAGLIRFTQAIVYGPSSQSQSGSSPFTPCATVRMILPYRSCSENNSIGERKADATKPMAVSYSRVYPSSGRPFGSGAESLSRSKFGLHYLRWQTSISAVKISQQGQKRA